MNLRLGAYAKSRGVRTVHVVCPQVWAWKRGRIPKIEAALDRLCCFFPFEPALFKPGLATFVGHPLAWSWGREEGRRKKEEGASGKMLAVLPGSRLGEIRHHMATLMETAAKLKTEFPGLRVVVPAANEKAYRAILDEMSRSGAGEGVEVRLGGARDVLREADAAVVASGTATLEAALAGCPTVLVYKVDPVFAFLARRFIKGVRHIGLANIIAEKAGTECPMPELLQEDFTAEAVAGRLRGWLADGEANASARRRLSETVARLRTGDDPIAEIARCL